MTMGIEEVSQEEYPQEAYSSMEQEKLFEFRHKVIDLELTDELLEDAQLIRWLRARNMDVSKAHQMLKDSLEWRKKNQMDGILKREEIPEEIRKLTPYASLGQDKQGYPLVLMPVGRQDWKQLLETYGMEKSLRYYLINCEKIVEGLRKLSSEHGRQFTQVVIIVDFEYYSYRQLTSKLLRDFLIRMQTTFDANYPEMLKRYLIINAPKAFSILYNLLKPFVSKRTLDKVDVFGTEKEIWKKVMEERIPLELLPLYWGGTRQGEDEYCSKDESIWLQGPVPISFFDPNSQSSDKMDSDSENVRLTTTTVKAGDALKLNLTVSNKNSSIAYQFDTENCDIGFKIVDAEGKELLPYRRARANSRGKVECQSSGVHTIVFDNSYSMFRSKTVNYNVSLTGVEVEGQDSNGNGSSRALVEE